MRLSGGRIAGLITAVVLGAMTPGASAAVTFNAAQPYPASAPWWITTGDVNGDGKLDVITASVSTDVISVLLGNGDGTLQPPLNTPAAPSFLDGVAAGDVNGDGRTDVAVAVSGTPGSARVYLANADGTLDTGTPYAAGNFPQDVVLARLDGNASLDLAVANQTSHDISVFLNNGSGGFSPAAGSPFVNANGNDFLGIGSGDFDGDGKTDLVAGGQNGSSPGIYFLAGTGTGGFPTQAPLGGALSQKPVAGDVNGDGRLDMVAGRSAAGDVAIVTRTATGFSTATTFDPDGAAGSSNGRIALGDLDGDGIPDLAVPNVTGAQANKVSVAVGNGDATFTTLSHEPIGGTPRQVAVGDLNGDTNPDLITSSSGGGNVVVLLAVPPGVNIPPALGFGRQPRGRPSSVQTITIRNDGPPRLRPGAVTLGGANAADFAVVSNTCSGASLAASATCAIGLRFAPGALGARAATLSMASNGGGSPHAVQLTGTGTLLPGRCANVQNGTRRRDRLIGTSAGDKLVGRGGNDLLSGRGGADCLSGGRGADQLTGGGGADRLAGGPGRNRYSAGPGNDRVNARNHKVELVNCGGGRRDRATVDRRDVVRGCEIVRRR
ncbi:MAG TPA: FG-GAP-like repeat-containing protein [Thermoleophilaceae bacterium]